MKGVSLPVNTIVVIALAVLVLLAVATWFVIEMGKHSQTIECEDVWNKACIQWKVSNCNQTEFENSVKNWNGIDGDNSIRKACECARGTSDYETCKKLCCGE